MLLRQSDGNIISSLHQVGVGPCAVTVVDEEVDNRVGRRSLSGSHEDGERE